MPKKKPSVGLFVTCLVDLMRPSIGFAAVKLIEDAGCAVQVPAAQTCCGQPAYNTGDRNGARQLALQTIAAFETFDYVVAPSGSCAGMLKKHYPALFDEGSAERTRADRLAEKTFELTAFLVDVRGMERVASSLDKRITYHDSCSSLREHGVKAQPRKLLDTIEGLHLVEMADTEVCCGFGGTFCVKYSDISNAMVGRKNANIEATGADLVLAGDLGCLMNIAGKLKRAGSHVEARHVAEVLAGMDDLPPIASAGGDR